MLEIGIVEGGGGGGGGRQGKRMGRKGRGRGEYRWPGKKRKVEYIRTHQPLSSESSSSPPPPICTGPALILSRGRGPPLQLQCPARPAAAG